MPCLQCGMCCKAIPINWAAKQKKNSSEGRAVSKYWKRMTRARALRVNPYLKSVPKTVKFYYCRMLNRETNRCKVYADRPDVCKNYPFYGNYCIASTCLIYDRCGYASEIHQRQVLGGRNNQKWVDVIVKIKEEEKELGKGETDEQ